MICLLIKEYTIDEKIALDYLKNKMEQEGAGNAQNR